MGADVSKARQYFYDAEAIREPCSPKTACPKTPSSGNKTRMNASHPGVRGNGWADGSVPYRPATRNRRSVWTIPTRPFPDAHFATFPESLVLPCVLAGTSEKGCCPSCGTPYRRKVRRRRYSTRSIQRQKVDITGKANRDPARHCTDTQTVGWARGCSCEATQAAPCVVLDPFAGTSTTGLVALKHGRRFMGIELSDEYCRMSRDRLKAA